MEILGFPHQVGGHFGILRASRGYVCKPLNSREYSFYSLLSQELLPYTPKFYGKIRVNIQTNDHGIVSMQAESTPNLQEPLDSPIELDKVDESTIITHEAEPEMDTRPLQEMTFRLRNKKVEAEQVLNLWAGECQRKVVQKLVNGHDKYFILLEDVVCRFSRPCVMDIKIGTRQYGPICSEEKRLSQQQKCRQSTSEKFGVRLVGLQLYDRASHSFQYINKYHGRQMNSASLKIALSEFLMTAGHERIKQLLTHLENLRVIMGKLDGYRFFSSSLLIAFDGSSSAEDQNIIVKMIDFAHSSFSGFLEDKPYPGLDEGYLLGLDSLLRFSKEILDQISSSFINEQVVNQNTFEDPVDMSTRARKRKHENSPR